AALRVLDGLCASGRLLRPAAGVRMPASAEVGPAAAPEWTDAGDPGAHALLPAAVPEPRIPPAAQPGGLPQFAPLYLADVCGLRDSTVTAPGPADLCVDSVALHDHRPLWRLSVASGALGSDGAQRDAGFLRRADDLGRRARGEHGGFPGLLNFHDA